MGETKEGLKIIAVVVLVLALGAVLYYFWLVAQPAYLNQENKNFKGSYQYSEARETELLNDISGYNGLETQKQKYIEANATTHADVIESIETQQKALVNEIHDKADLIPDQTRLPQSVRDFMIEHPRE